MDDYIPDDFDLPDAHARVQPPPIRQARPVPPPAHQARLDPPPPPLVACLSSPRKEVQVEDDPMEEWDEDALIAAAEAELAAQDEQEVRAFNGRVYERPDQVALERPVGSSEGESNAVAGPSRPKAPPSSSSTSNASKTVKSSQPHQPPTHPFFSSSATTTSISRPSKPPPPSRSKVKADTVTISSSDESEAASSKIQPKKKLKKESGKKGGTSGTGKSVKGWEKEVEVIELD